MANESYEEFAEKLQREYEVDEGIRFGYFEKHTFANISVLQEDGTTQYLGLKPNQEEIYKFFGEKKYIIIKARLGYLWKRP